jgi:hypothetical protein
MGGRDRPPGSASKCMVLLTEATGLGDEGLQSSSSPLIKCLGKAKRGRDSPNITVSSILYHQSSIWLMLGLAQNHACFVTL